MGDNMNDHGSMDAQSIDEIAAARRMHLDYVASHIWLARTQAPSDLTTHLVRNKYRFVVWAGRDQKDCLLR